MDSQGLIELTNLENRSAKCYQRKHINCLNGAKYWNCYADWAHSLEAQAEDCFSARLFAQLPLDALCNIARW